MHNFHWTPNYWAGLKKREKAIVIAGIDIKIKEEERERKRAESKARHRH